MSSQRNPPVSELLADAAEGYQCSWGRQGGRIACAMNGAARPAFLLVDEDREALDALRRVLERRFRADYEIAAQTQPERGPSALQRLRERDGRVAVIIAAWQMQPMAGEQFLELAHELHPLSGRALICAAFDRRAEQSILHAMALGRADMILVRPWDPAEHRLYPRVGMLLDRWG